MGTQNYNRPALHNVIDTPIDFNFQINVESNSPGLFVIANQNTTFAHHATLVVGDETYQFITPGTSRLVTNDDYIALYRDPAGGGSLISQMQSLQYALQNNAASYFPGGSGPLLSDGVTPAKEHSQHKFVVKLVRYVDTIPFGNFTVFLFVWNGLGNNSSDMVMNPGTDQIPSVSNNAGLIFMPQSSDAAPFGNQFEGPMNAEVTSDTLNLVVRADADERATVALWATLFEAEVSLNLSAAGLIELVLDTQPIEGNGVPSPVPFPTIITVPHEQDMDTWQTAAGRPRQDFAGEDGNEHNKQLLYEGEVL